MAEVTQAIPEQVALARAARFGLATIAQLIPFPTRGERLDRPLEFSKDPTADAARRARARDALQRREDRILRVRARDDRPGHPFQRSISVFGMTPVVCSPTAKQLVESAQETLAKVLVSAPEGLGLGTTDHSEPLQRAVSGLAALP